MVSECLRVQKGKRSMELIRKKSRTPMQVNRNGQVEYLTFPLLSKTGMVRHLFSTRIGGVSKGSCASMNFSFHRGDEPAAVAENYRRIAQILGTVPERFVCSMQTHTTHIRQVTEADCGKGVTRALDYADVDGLITNEPEIVLVTMFADCVPLYLVDTKNHAIGLGHSGWRGTVGRMGRELLLAMERAYGTRVADVTAAIGPSICQDCYEVGEEVAQAFMQEFSGEKDKILKKGSAPGKYQLDLWEANRLVFLEAGIPEKQLAVTDLCTCCNPNYLFSHRASQGKRGNLAAFMELRKF